MPGLALVCAAALTLSACGGGGATATDKTAVAPPKPRAQSPTAGGSCQSQVGGLLKSMTALRGNLAVGLSYEQYAAAMQGIKAAYDEVPVAKLTIDCLSGTGAPAEKALNEYIDAANAWGECLAEIGCGTASIEARLQRKWRVASHFLAAALKRSPVGGSRDQAGEKPLAGEPERARAARRRPLRWCMERTRKPRPGGTTPGLPLLAGARGGFRRAPKPVRRLSGPAPPESLEACDSKLGPPPFSGPPIEANRQEGHARSSTGTAQEPPTARSLAPACRPSGLPNRWLQLLMTSLSGSLTLAAKMLSDIVAFANRLPTNRSQAR